MPVEQGGKGWEREEAGQGLRDQRLRPGMVEDMGNWASKRQVSWWTKSCKDDIAESGATCVLPGNV